MKIAIFGIGLIGGSIGRATLKKTTHTVLGYDKDDGAMLKGEMLGAFSSPLKEEDLANVDLVVLAVKPSVATMLLPQVAAKLKDGATIIDCCGTKRRVVAEMEKLHTRYPALNFVGVHPMAGREFSGVEHSTAGLFEHSYFIVTPVHTDIRALTALKEYFLELGCDGVQVATAQQHDREIAFTSQLAHIVSGAYVKNPLSVAHAGFSAGSFRDMTRVAKLDPDLWTELFIENGDNLVAQIDDLSARLAEYRTAIADKDAGRLHDLLQEGVSAKAAAENAIKERKKND